MINCIILDDEPLAVKVIENFINKTDYLNCIGSFSNCNESLPFLKKNKVDLMFLDINMPFIDGISFLKKLQKYNMKKLLISAILITAILLAGPKIIGNSVNQNLNDFISNLNEMPGYQLKIKNLDF